MIRLALLGAAIALPVQAEEVTRAFLEQPGKVWVSADLPIAVEAGLIVPIIPYARFDAGRIETGFLSPLVWIYDADCPDQQSCDTVTAMGVYRTGAYTLDGGTLTTGAEPLDQWIFDRPDPDIVRAISKSGFLSGDNAILTRDGDRLIQSRAEGTRSYDALTPDEMWDGTNLARAFEASITLTYACTAQALHDFRQVAPDDYSAEDAEFAAFLRFARWQAALRREEEILLAPRSEPSGDFLTPDEVDRQAQIRATLFLGGYGASTYTRHLMEGGMGEIPDEARDEVVEFLNLIKSRSPDPAALQADFETHAADIELASRMMARFRIAQQAGADGYQQVVCDR